MGTHSQHSFGSTLATLLRSAAGLAHAWRQRRELTRLIDLDDRMLADIGLTRQDLTAALAEPLLVDASESLAAVARRSSWEARVSAMAAGQRQARETSRAA